MGREPWIPVANMGCVEAALLQDQTGTRNLFIYVRWKSLALVCDCLDLSNLQLQMMNDQVRMRQQYWIANKYWIGLNT